MTNKVNSGLVTLAYREPFGESERRLEKIIEFMGGSVVRAKVIEPASLSGSKRLIISARALKELGIENLRAEDVLVYGFEDPVEILGIHGTDKPASGNPMVSVNAGSREICQQFAGLTFKAYASDLKATFTGTTACETLIAVENKPYFVRIKDSGRNLLLLAAGEFVDIDRLAPRGTSLVEYFLRLTPVMMFLRASTPQEFWHNDAPAACLVIDDPLIQSRYGFLHYEKLLRLMEEKQFHTSIAFIPWNCRRTNRKFAKFFTTVPRRYSICVHGSDHTQREFAVTETVARHKARQALERMKVHRERSGIDFDDVMVFPQCRFSTAAMAALKDCGYLAVANSSEYPVDVTEGIPLRDLLSVAITRFSNVPLFIRRAALNVAELAFDLFLGKPALMVEHHAFFRDNYNAVAGIVEKVHGLDAHLRWADLATICSQAHVKRNTDSGEVQVRFFTDRFVFENTGAERQRFIFLREAMPGTRAAGVTVNGQAVAYDENSDVTFALSLDPAQRAEIQIAHKTREVNSAAVSRSAVYEAKVAVRRVLSEIRDHYLQPLQLS